MPTKLHSSGSFIQFFIIKDYSGVFDFLLCFFQNYIYFLFSLCPPNFS